jgi:hypothetical protein
VTVADPTPDATATVPGMMRLGDVVELTFADGRGRRAALRLADGLAVCLDPIPADADPRDQEAMLGWFVARERRWALLTEAGPEWVIATWQPGQGEPVAVDADAMIAERDAGETLDLVAAAVTLAARLFPAWSGYEVQTAVSVEVVYLWQHPGLVS